MAIGTALENTDLVVDPLQQTEPDRVLWVTVRGDAVGWRSIIAAWQALVMFRSKTRGSPSIPEQVLAYTITPMSIESNPCAGQAHTFHYHVFVWSEDGMALVYSIEPANHQQLARAGTCSLDKLTALLPGYSWAQVFAAMDRLTRESTVALKHLVQLRYLISLAPRRTCRGQLGDDDSEKRARIGVGLLPAVTLC
jgi:hypothetical protein